MAKFFQATIGGKQVEIPIADDTPEGITAGLRAAFPGSELRFPSDANALEDLTPATTTTPTTDPDGGGLSLNRIAQVLTGTSARAADNARADNPIAAAVKERTLDPLLRLNRPAGSDLNGLFGPEPGLLSNLSDVLTVGSAAIQPELAAVGAGADALTRSLGQSATTGRAVGGATELLTSLFGAAGLGALTGRAGRKIIGAAPAEIKMLPVANDLMPMEKISTELTDALSKEFRHRSAALGRAFDTVETAVGQRSPFIQNGTDGYAKLQEILDYTNDSVATFGGAGGEALGRIAAKVDAGEAVPTADVIRLRKGLKDLATRGRSVDPDLAANAKKAVHVRGQADAVLETLMDPATLTDWRRAKSAWGSTVAEPLSVLHNVIDTKSAYDAFRAVFQDQDPEVFRTVLRVARETPSVAGKLKLGFLEVLRENTDTFQNAAKFQAIFEHAKPMVEAAGLFTPEEMSALDTFIRRKAIIPVTKALTQAFSPGEGSASRIRIGTGLAVTYALTSNPTALFLAGAASGALPAMRKLATLPAGSAAGKRAALEVATQISRLASSLMSDRAQSIEPGETPTP